MGETKGHGVGRVRFADSVDRTERSALSTSFAERDQETSKQDLAYNEMISILEKNDADLDGRKTRPQIMSERSPQPDYTNKLHSDDRDQEAT